MITATISSAFRLELIRKIINSTLVSGIRYNTGVPSLNTPYEILSQLLYLTRKPLWIDLKCRQLRVAEWCIPYYSEVLLNHEIELDLPAWIYFRGGSYCEIKGVKGNKVFLKEFPREAIGKGQSVVIKSKSLRIKEFFTPEDLDYIQAANMLGINRFMISFFEDVEDIAELKKILKRPNDATIALKIESTKGVDTLNWMVVESDQRLVVARDDLSLALDDPTQIIEVEKKCLEMDPHSIVASQLLLGLCGEGITVADVSDVYCLHLMGFKNFMLSDEICLRSFDEAISFWEHYCARKETL